MPLPRLDAGVAPAGAQQVQGVHDGASGVGRSSGGRMAEASSDLPHAYSS